MQRANASYTFGRFYLDSAERRLLSDGQAIPLTPKAFDILLMLVRNDGHVLTKDELMRAVWPDGFVEEINLAYNISILRKVLADGQAGTTYIETVPKIGYRFVMPVSDVELDVRRRTNLPAQLTRFIGRETELAEVVRAVDAKRMVTLTGAAGMGKTRLALECGRVVLDQFADGVWLTELAPIADGALVPNTVLAALGLLEQPGRLSIDVITTFLAEKHMLVILDNCEHVIEASARLAESLLRECRRLHILTTSREALRLPGEVIWRIPSLSTPDPANLPQLDCVANYDAVRLFVEHAALAQSDFTLTPDHFATVARICHQLDGMPLAIEMAAAQIAFLGLAGVATGLDHRFLMLTSGSRTALPHQQTLRATLDWSYNLLTEPERTLLAKLSVFAGGYTAETAQAVCSDDMSPVLPLLLQLARKSLMLTVINEHDDQQRYRLLESVRHYAAEKLRERGESEATRDRHLAHFLELVEKPIDLAGPPVDLWVRHIDSEYDNVRTAFTWSMVCEDEGEKAMRLVNAMMTYSFNRGHLVEVGDWVDQASSRGDSAPVYARARLRMAKTGINMLKGAKVLGLRYCEDALTLFRQTDDRLGLARCLEALANNAFNEHAQVFAEEALLLFRELGSKDGEGRALRALGSAALHGGDHARAAQLLEKSLEIAKWDGMACLVYLYDADPRRALELCAQQHVRSIQSDGSEFEVAMMEAYGILLLAQREYEQARQVVEECIQARRQGGAGQHVKTDLLTLPLPLDISGLRMPDRASIVVPFSYDFAVLGFAEMMLGRIEQAHVRLDQAHNFAREAGVTVLEIIIDFLKTSLTITQDQTDVAKREVFQCLRRFSQVHYPLGSVCSLVQAAEVIKRQGNLKLPCMLFGAAEVHSQEADVKSSFLYRIPSLWLRHAQQTIIMPSLAEARAQLGEAECNAVFATGQRMTLDEAVALALRSE